MSSIIALVVAGISEYGKAEVLHCQELQTRNTDRARLIQKRAIEPWPAHHAGHSVGYCGALPIVEWRVSCLGYYFT